MRVAELIEQLSSRNPHDPVEITCFFCGGEVEPQLLLESDRVVVMCKECAATPNDSD